MKHKSYVELGTNFSCRRMQNRKEFQFGTLSIFLLRNMNRKMRAFTAPFCAMHVLRFMHVHIRGGSCKGMRQRKVRFCYSYNVKHSLCILNMHIPRNMNWYQHVHNYLMDGLVFWMYPLITSIHFFHTL